MKNVMSGKPDYSGPCVYSITNDVTSRVYIGSTRNAKSRYSSHLAAMKRMAGENPGILSDLKDGHTFTFKIEEKFPENVPQIILNDAEAKAIKSTKNPYNISNSIVTRERLIEFIDFHTGPARKFIPRYVKSFAYAFHYRDLLLNPGYQQRSYSAEHIDEAVEELCRIVKEAAENLKQSI